MSDKHVCCFHRVERPIWIVLKPDHVLVECCICYKTEQVHKDHVPGEWARRPENPEKSVHWEGHCRKYKATYNHDAAF